MLKKNLYIKTYGCQMNVYDSDRMADVLAPHGYQSTESPDTADIIILNTCHIREKATEKLFSELGRMHPFKIEKEQSGQPMLLIVAGCVAQAEGAEIVKRVPYVDIVVGPQTYHRLPEMIERAKRSFLARQQDEDLKKEWVVETDFPVESKFDHLPTPSNSGRYSAFLSIQEGCDKFCTFCVVPYTRGAEFSRSVMDIVKEAKDLIQQGVREITLLGQNVNAYHGLSPDSTKEWGLGSLILKLAELDGLDRIRYMTSHPRDMDQELIDVHGSCDKLMPVLHLPVQSGSNRILEAMNRKHTREFYLGIIEKLRSVRKDIIFSSDFIIGFPGETEADFEETISLIQQVRFEQASYSFGYSPRPGTPASVYDNQIPEPVKAERLKILQDLLNQQQREFNESMLGKTMPILFERIGRFPGQFIGRSPYMHSIHVASTENLMGQILNVEITAVKPFSLEGRL